MEAKITKRQLKHLQVLYSQLAHKTLDAGSSRESRLAWASDQLHHAVASFNDLSHADARQLITAIQRRLGIRAAARPRKTLSRGQAQRAGKDGRHDGKQYDAQPQLASADDLATIEGYYARLGWSRAQFDGWLRSPRSPLKHKAAPSIRTLSDANRVRWALKGMLQHAGLWYEKERG
jgi:hypothetical protein